MSLLLSRFDSIHSTTATAFFEGVKCEAGVESMGLVELISFLVVCAGLPEQFCRIAIMLAEAI